MTRTPTRTILLGTALTIMIFLALPLMAGPVEAAPPNDNLASSTLVGPLPYTNTVDTTASTNEGGEVPPACKLSAFPTTVWYTFTGTGSAVQVDTFGSAFDTALAVYTGNAYPLAPVPGACSDNTSFGNPHSQVVFNTTPGTPYRIQVAGVGGVAGNLRLNVHTPNFVVNSFADTNDGNCDSNTAVAVDCTLREAINASNTFSNPANVISFNIPGGGTHTITPGPGGLPSIIRPVSIDGTTEPGYLPSATPLIQLDGVAAGGGVNGLAFSSVGGGVKGLSIYRFGFAGVHLSPSAQMINIEENRIGTNGADAPGLGNGTGVAIFGTNNSVGGNLPAQRNIISGNISNGVYIVGASATFNFIEGNYIGTRSGGVGSLPNNIGVLVTGGAKTNVIGGDYLLGYANVISGNTTYGVWMTAAGTINNMLGANAIGTDYTGTAAVPNGVGVQVDGGASSNQIGLGGPNYGNLISGNTGDGVVISSPGTNTNSLAGNGIGINLSGTAALPNGGRGVHISNGPSSTFIGGPSTSERNYISGNGGIGIDVVSAASTTIEGNYIGLNGAGTALIGASGNGGICGVRVTGPSTGTSVGGSFAGEGNAIAGPSTAAVCVYAPATGTNIVNNTIGTDATASAPLLNLGAGVLVNDTSAFIVSNVVGGNTVGIDLSNSTTSTIGGNFVGTNTTAIAVLPNGTGIRLGGTTNDTTVGGNRVAHNSGAGIALIGTGTDNLLDSNAVHDNGALGIDLGHDGVTLNDALDADLGPNGFTNYPVIHAAYPSGGNTVINMTLSGLPNSSYFIQLFDSAACDPSGFGEGEIYLTTVPMSTDGAGFGSLNQAVPPVALGRVLTATSINFGVESLSTSEFSACKTVATCLSDLECDGFMDVAPILHEGPLNTNTAFDTCLDLFNPIQLNNDGNFFDTTPPLTQNDLSRPMSDAAGDQCDNNDDNDGINDADETSLPGPACAAATAALDALNPDTDGDGYLDGAECAIGTNPNLPGVGNKPTDDQCRILAGAPAIPTDTDGDLVQDRIEVCGHNTSPSSTDSDGDGRPDKCEVASINHLAPVNSLDQLLLAQAIIADLGGPFVYNADLNKNGANNSADQLLMAQILISGGC